MFSHLVRPDATQPVGVAFTDRAGGHSSGSLGPLNLGRLDADDPAAVERNGATVAARLGLDVLVALDQVHGADVLTVDRDFLAGWGPRHWLGEAAGLPALPRADAAVTDQSGIGLMVRVADCVPVLLADASAGVVGGAHAGRAGFDLGVLPATVEAMYRLGAREIRAWIGPHVCGECYEVPQEMADQTDARHPGVAARTSWGTASLDLGVGCVNQLTALGVRTERVDPCTLTTPGLHSHRRDGAGAGRQAGIIWRVS
ncbi:MULTISPECIES: polyphenol oxidase family protein [unclassified Luteococcus]|uniref:polyphenol oxidase family protein n=1 Tax=unclassified Luteococcus TaxID=2639923 RepID=UPI00313E03F5